MSVYDNFRKGYLKYCTPDDNNNAYGNNTTDFKDKDSGAEAHVDPNTGDFNCSDEDEVVDAATKCATESMLPDSEDKGGYGAETELSEEDKKPIQSDYEADYRRKFGMANKVFAYVFVNPFLNWVAFSRDDVNEQVAEIDKQIEKGYFPQAERCCQFLMDAHQELEAQLKPKLDYCHQQINNSAETSAECNKLFSGWGNALNFNTDKFTDDVYAMYIQRFDELKKLGVTDSDMNKYNNYCNMSKQLLEENRQEASDSGNSGMSGMESSSNLGTLNDDISDYEAKGITTVELYEGENDEEPSRTFTVEEWYNYLASLEKVTLPNGKEGYRGTAPITIDSENSTYDFSLEGVHTHTPNAKGYKKVPDLAVALNTSNEVAYCMYYNQFSKQYIWHICANIEEYNEYKAGLQKVTDAKGNVGYYISNKPYTLRNVAPTTKLDGLKADVKYHFILMTEMELDATSNTVDEWIVRDKVFEDMVYLKFMGKPAFDAWLSSVLSTAQTENGVTYYYDCTVGMNKRFTLDLNSVYKDGNTWVLPIDTSVTMGYKETPDHNTFANIDNGSRGKYKNFYEEDNKKGYEGRQDAYNAYNDAEPLYKSVNINGKPVSYALLKAPWINELYKHNGWEKVNFFTKQFNADLTDNVNYDNITSIGVVQGVPYLNGVLFSIADIKPDMFNNMPAEYRAKLAHNDLYYLVGWKEWVLKYNKKNITSMYFSREEEYSYVIGRVDYQRLFDKYYNLETLTVGETTLTREDIVKQTPRFTRAQSNSSFRSRWSRATDGYHLNIMKGTRNVKEYAWKMITDYRERSDVHGIRKFFGLVNRHLWHAITWVTDFGVTAIGGTANIITGKDAVTHDDFRGEPV